MRFIVVTRDYAVLGFALRLQDEGQAVSLAPNPEQGDISDPQACKRYQSGGENMVAKDTLADLLGKRSSLRDAYWIWDLNHSVEENEILRAEGFKVLGGGQHAYTME